MTTQTDRLQRPPSLSDQFLESLVDSVGQHVLLRVGEGRQTGQMGVHVHEVGAAAQGEVPHPQLLEREVGVGVARGQGRLLHVLGKGALVAAHYRRRRAAESTTARAASASAAPSS